MPYIKTPGGMVFVPEKGAKHEQKGPVVDLSKKSVLVMDRGLYVYLAQFLSRFYGTVYYHCITGGPYEHGPISMIGKDMPGIVHTRRPGDIIRTVDDLTVFFPDIYDGDQQEMLRHFGVAVCGAGKAEIMEMDKLFFYEQAKAAGLPVADMHLCQGLDELEAYSKEHEGPLYVKLRDHYRDDWETCCLDDPADTEELIAVKRQKLGAKRAAEMEFLCYEPIESECEGGVDGFKLGGQLSNLISCGYECKDMGFLTKIMDTVPKVLEPTISKLAPIYESMGYRGPYSNECRITKDGIAFPIDETNRCGEPPTSVFSELLGASYAEAVYLLARGIMPTLKAEAVYGAQVNLSSAWHKENKLYVSFPPELEPWVKLKNAYRWGDRYYCTPNDNDGGFGSVVAIGKSVEEVTRLVMQRVEQVKARGMEYKVDLFDCIGEAIKAGEKFGIKW